VSPYRFDPPVSPHYAAELADVQIEPTELLAKARNAADHADVLVCEGVGGILVPLTVGYLIRDLAIDLGIPAVIAARPGLGTINHTLLTLEAARTAGLDVRGVVITPWPADSDPMAESNRRTVELIGNVAVTVLPQITRDELAEAGRQLPLDDWLHSDEGDHAA
jgi:dethiobiotin synthetase